MPFLIIIEDAYAFADAFYEAEDRRLGNKDRQAIADYAKVLYTHKRRYLKLVYDEELVHFLFIMTTGSETSWNGVPSCTEPVTLFLDEPEFFRNFTVTDLDDIKSPQSLLRHRFEMLLKQRFLHDDGQVIMKFDPLSKGLVLVPRSTLVTTKANK